MILSPDCILLRKKNERQCVNRKAFQTRFLSNRISNNWQICCENIKRVCFWSDIFRMKLNWWMSMQMKPNQHNTYTYMRKTQIHINLQRMKHIDLACLNRKWEKRIQVQVFYSSRRNTHTHMYTTTLATHTEQTNTNKHLRMMHIVFVKKLLFGYVFILF